jgi:hypothetical protein
LKVFARMAKGTTNKLVLAHRAQQQGMEALLA